MLRAAGPKAPADNGPDATAPWATMSALAAHAPWARTEPEWDPGWCAREREPVRQKCLHW